jgi:FkbM family methyltransferase
MAHLQKIIHGKWNAAKTLATQMYFLSNWKDVFAAYRSHQPLPPLRLRNGLAIHHREGDPAWSLFEEIFVDKCYTRPGFYTPSQGDCVIDLGANIGLFALYLQTAAPGIKVNCFEPSAGTRAQLEKNISANGFDENVVVHPYAIMNKDESRTLHKAEYSGSSSFFLANKAGGEEVKCITLAKAIEKCGAAQVDLLKIDTEGAEIEILDGVAPETWKKIKRVVLEYHEDVRPGCYKILMETLKPHYSNVKSWSTSPTGLLGVIQAT